MRVFIGPNTMIMITCRINTNAHTFNGAYDHKVFSNWLVDMDYYFDWCDISEKRKI